MSARSKKIAAEQPGHLPTLAHLLIEAGVTHPPEAAYHIEMGQQPWRHQCDLVNRLLVFDRYGVYDEPGTGKTLPTLAAAIYNVLVGNRLVVVMPPALLFQIMLTIRAVFKNSGKYVSIHVYDQSPAKRRSLEADWSKDISSRPSLLLMSYDIFRKEWETAQKLGYVGLVADEAHALKSPGTQVYRAALDFLGKPGERLFWPMTGTPIPNELTDAYGLISLVTPDLYSGYDQFERLHCRFTRMKIQVKGRERMVPKLVGYFDEDLIKQRLFKQARRVLRSHVLDVDEPQLVPMPVQLSRSHRDLYRLIMRRRYVTVNGEIIQANNQQRLRQMLLQCIAVPQRYSETKIDNALEAWLDQLRDTIDVKKNKLVVVTHFQATSDYLVEKFRAEGTNPAAVYGGKYGMTAQKAMDLFNNDPNCREMVLQPKSGGAGLDMQHASHFMALYEPPSTPGDLDQLVARICRGGQKEPVSIYYPQVLRTAMIARFENCVDKKGRSDSVTLTASDFLKEMLGDDKDEADRLSDLAVSF